MAIGTAWSDPSKDQMVRETLENYTRRFAPRGYRRWCGCDLGGFAYLADFSIGAGIGLSYGTLNARVSILVAAVIIFGPGAVSRKVAGNRANVAKTAFFPEAARTVRLVARLTNQGPWTRD
ncbi:hypothetical protein [Saccharopolyspora phatthalungensis]|uniref:Uncharacterized protein n=1 Tax=Saccharopolyspora phatthalungensis TaxID=664693 RepID=A0A840Q5J4_9PSEU|nr:hypothetical protein [Saccharopolyspora phatthalungensis]MBB5153998.1 hypothetical protein [Saccharopolyspora phatthalungensis]